MSAERAVELAVVLEEMRAASDIFYGLAIATNFHQFVELNGFISEFIKICERLLESGIDFQLSPLRLEEFHARYVGEKLGCLFGSTLSETGNLSAFLIGLFELERGTRVEVDADPRRGLQLRIGPGPWPEAASMPGLDAEPGAGAGG